ncbi:MAG: adenosylmethionine--8-amino-7-oxononanoate transaminase [bacterium]
MNPEELKKKDKQYVWHPFTQMKRYRDEEPVVIESGDGVKLTDVDGNEYYDGVSSLWVNVHGHNVDEIDQAIREQLDEVAHSTLLGQGNVASTKLAEQLVEVTPDGLNKVFYSDSGATAVEIAMKMAIQFWANRAGQPTDRKRFLTFKGGYHGDTFGPMSVVPDPEFHWPFESLLPEPIQVEYPYVKEWPGSNDPDEVLRQSLDKIEATLEEHGDELAGILVEPVQGAGGIVPPVDGFLSGLKEVTKGRDLFLIVDEVATGFGRTGPMFACDSEDVTPDIMCLGKGITGGYSPVAATMATDEIYQQFLGERHEGLLHGHSYTGNALGCAAALASLEKLKQIRPELPEKIQHIRDELQSIGELEIVYDVRQAGFMCGIEIMEEPKNMIPFDPDDRASWEVCNYARENGMLLRPLGDVIVFMPPQGSTKDELGDMIDILERSIKQFQSAL